MSSPMAVPSVVNIAGLSAFMLQMLELFFAWVSPFLMVFNLGIINSNQSL